MEGAGGRAGEGTAPSPGGIGGVTLGLRPPASGAWGRPPAHVDAEGIVTPGVPWVGRGEGVAVALGARDFEAQAIELARGDGEDAYRSACEAAGGEARPQAMKSLVDVGAGWSARVGGGSGGAEPGAGERVPLAVQARERLEDARNEVDGLVGMLERVLRADGGLDFVVASRAPGGEAPHEGDASAIVAAVLEKGAALERASATLGAAAKRAARRVAASRAKAACLQALRAKGWPLRKVVSQARPALPTLTAHAAVGVAVDVAGELGERLGVPPRLVEIVEDDARGSEEGEGGDSGESGGVGGIRMALLPLEPRPPAGAEDVAWYARSFCTSLAVRLVENYGRDADGNDVDVAPLPTQHVLVEDSIPRGEGAGGGKGSPEQLHRDLLRMRRDLVSKALFDILFREAGRSGALSVPRDVELTPGTLEARMPRGAFLLAGLVEPEANEDRHRARRAARGAPLALTDDEARERTRLDAKVGPMVGANGPAEGAHPAPADAAAAQREWARWLLDRELLPEEMLHAVLHWLFLEWNSADRFRGRNVHLHGALQRAFTADHVARYAEAPLLGAVSRLLEHRRMCRHAHRVLARLAEAPAARLGYTPLRRAALAVWNGPGAHPLSRAALVDGVQPMTSAFELVGRDPVSNWVALRIKVVIREGQGYQVLLEEDEALAVGGSAVPRPAELGDWPVLTDPWTGEEVRGDAALRTNPAVTDRGALAQPLAHQSGVEPLELARLVLEIFASAALAVFQGEALARGLPSRRQGTALVVRVGDKNARRRLYVVVRVECPASLEARLEDFITGVRPAGNPLDVAEGEEPVPPAPSRPGVATPFEPLAFAADGGRWGLHLEAYVEAEADVEAAGDDPAKRRKVRRDVDVPDVSADSGLAGAAKHVFDQA